MKADQGPGGHDFPQVPEEFEYAPTKAEESLRLMRPWWHENVGNVDEPAHRAELEELIWLAITHSPHVQSVLLEPQILDSRATQKLGVFDPNRFVDSIFKDTSDPVGNSLVTGGPPRLNDNLWENRAGVRAKNQYGGQTEFFQEMLFKDSNSRFFIPGNQSDSRLVLQYTQPLKRGRGASYNRSSFVIATFAANQSRYQASSALQEHAYQITEAYWNLFASRVSQVQIRRGVDNLEQLRKRLGGRAEIDSVRSQLLRADAAIAKQNAAMAYSRAQVRSSEANLRALIAAPELRNSQLQIIPITDTITSPPELDGGNERLAALEHQPRILEIQEEIKAARTKLQVAQNELQPTLNLVLQGYLHGLSGNYEIGKSVENQFNSTPSYHAGIAYQRPKGNIAAQAIARESRMELRRALLRLDDTLLSVSANVESALAAVEAAFQQLDSAVRSTLATQAEIQYLEAQWNDAFMSGDTRGSLQLDQLLNAHIQLIVSENGWVNAERDYMLALARLDLATGKLLPTFNCP
jgi:outer membrane protein TolC